LTTVDRAVLECYAVLISS